MAEENKRPDPQDQGKAVEDAIRAAEALAGAKRSATADQASAANAAHAAEEEAAKAHADDEAESVNAEDVKETQAPKEDADAAAEAIDNSKEEKKGFFGKKKDKELEALKGQIAEFDDKFKRQMAEFENFRKRTDKEKEQMFSLGEKNILEKFLPIVDNFERGFDTVTEEDKDDAFVLGMHKVYEQLLKQLSDVGVTPIDAVGQDFDPEFHNAVMQVDSDGLETGKVAQELQKGYMYHDTVLRHSMVSVVK